MDISGQRSTINEIKTKYKFNPSLTKTIYVEGATDRPLIQWFLKQKNIDDILVLKIDTVEVPKDKVEQLELEDNNRNRIITLTTLIENNIIGIIDSDFDFMQETNYPKKNHLLKTDYTTMEMYLYNEESLDKIFLGHKENKKVNYFLELDSILIELFLITYAKKNIKNELSKIDFTKELTLKSNMVSFQRDKYLSKYVQNKKDLIQKFNTFIDTIKNKLPKDKRKIINGHDFVDLLQFYLEINHKDSKEVFTKSLYSSFEYNKLKKEDMFKKLTSLIEEKS